MTALSVPATQPVTPSPWRAAAALTWREIIRFVRQRNRIVASIGTPLVFWLLFGAGLSGSFRIGAGAGQQSFLTYFFPGSLILIVLFTAIFSSISIIEDRREGFLQGVLVAPIPRWSMVLGKVMGGTLVALVQGLIFLLLGLTLPVALSMSATVQLIALLFVAAFALTSLGTVAATLAQPRLARRFGQISSVVIVQAASIPFLVILGFSPILWTVVLAMVVRNSLMNAGNPIFAAFAMERVTPRERATLSAAMSVLWQLGWVVGGAWYALLQAVLGFDAGYAVNFLTVITLYSLATLLYWAWFRDVDRRTLAARAAGP